jgi:uncharacterized RDD family membrane protein YckC
MKCPKCDYLGFETTDRCRNCGYDFSLAPFSPEPDLALRHPDKNLEAAPDLDLPSAPRQPEGPGFGGLDLDRLFGAEGKPVAAEPARVVLPNTQVVDVPVARRDGPAELLNVPAAPSGVETVFDATPASIAPAYSEAAEGAAQDLLPEDAAGADLSALPFGDAPHAPPPPARQPLAVRRTTPEIPRGRSRTAKPVRTGSLLGLDGPAETVKRTAVTETSVLLDPPSIGARVGADLIDALLMASIDAAVLVLTLRIAGLSMTVEDMRIVPAVPFVGFLALLGFVYVATFTVAGGQTIGKMVTGIKVICDDGRSVDTADGVLRALGCVLVPLTLGLSYVPVFLTSDRRALHDRLAGTRVVSR